MDGAVGAVTKGHGAVGLKSSPVKIKTQNTSAGFTIVELLIVVVVIAILAAITIVSYNGIRSQAIKSQVQAAVSQANKKILAHAVQNSDQYPTILADAGVSDTDSIKYQYTSDNVTVPRAYAVTASNGVSGNTQYYISSMQPKLPAGIAPGHNLIAWDGVDGATAPAAISTGIAIDASVYRSGVSSVRLGPGKVGVPLRNNPFTGVVGQQYTVSLWVKTDSSWNGTGGNSKIRFGAHPDGTLLTACVYNGVKLTWTQVTCTYTLTATVTAVTISVGNDGTVGNIWLDSINVILR